MNAWFRGRSIILFDESALNLQVNEGLPLWIYKMILLLSLQIIMLFFLSPLG